MTSDEPMTLLEFKNQRIMHWAGKAAELAEALTNANRVIEQQAQKIEALQAAINLLPSLKDIEEVEASALRLEDNCQQIRRLKGFADMQRKANATLALCTFARAGRNLVAQHDR